MYKICYLPKSVGSEASRLDSNADSSIVSDCDIGAIALAGYKTGKVSAAIVELVGSTEVVGIRVGVDGTFRVDVSIGSVGIGGGVVAVGKRIVPMLYISFIENAFKYGVSTEGESLIEIQQTIF